MKILFALLFIVISSLSFSQTTSDSNQVDSCYLYIPNVSSVDCEWPDDSYTFQIFSNCEMIEFELTIYNRWAEVMFKSNDIHATWYGGDQTETVFIYKLCGTSVCGQDFDDVGQFTILK
jgi:hypothetical protein